MAEKKFIPLYFGLVFILLLSVYFPTFSHPFRSDYWTAAYFFHGIDNGGWYKWLHIFQYDPWTRVRFQPLAISLLYFVWKFLGANFTFFHVLNFCLYYISLLLLYRLARVFCQSKPLILAFLTLFAFLFSHFDIVCWSYHIYIIFGLNCFLLGFIVYINFLNSGKKVFLLFVSFLFLSGMLCYESFILWPLAIMLLNYINNVVKKQKFKKNELLISSLSVIGLAYFFYTTFFLFVRFFNFYHQSLIGQFFSLSNIIFTIFSTFFNIFYNGLLINILPFLACPLKLDSNLNMKFLPQGYSYFLVIFMAGAIFLIFLPKALFLYQKKSFKDLRKNIYFVLFLFLLFFIATFHSYLFKYYFYLDLKLIIFTFSSIMIYIFLQGIKYLLRQKHFGLLKISLFFLFLLFSQFFVLFCGRNITNPSSYIFTQFRYQYISNAFVILMILFLIDNVLKPSKGGKAIIYIAIFVILMVNINTTNKYGISVLNRQLAPLKKLFLNIKMSIRDGEVNKDNRLYLSDDIAGKLPPLCWNREMGERFINRGTYQWVFKEIDYFSFTAENAKWIIDIEDLRLVSKEEFKNEGK